MALDLDKLNRSQTGRSSASSLKKDPLKECTKEDDTALELISWSESVLTFGKLFSIIVIVVGLILSFISASITNEVSGFSIFISDLINYLLIAILIYGSSKSLSILLTGLSKIVQYTRNSSRFAEFQARQLVASEDSEEDSAPKEQL